MKPNSKRTNLKGCFVLLAWLPALAQPVITTQPNDRFLAPGVTATFSVSATGVPPLTYQWLFEGAALGDATNKSLSLPSPAPAQWGDYSVVVGDSSGSVTSRVARLKVFVAAPHALGDIHAGADGSVTLGLAGETTPPLGAYYDLYPLESSSNLVDWTPLATLQRTNAALDTLHFADADAPSLGQRFYRIPNARFPTPDPAPTGPYPVGTFSMLLTNTLRTPNFKFMVTFWYPAVAQAGVLPARYVEPQVATGSGQYNLTAYGGGSFGSQVAGLFSHSLSDAPVAPHAASFPVILYQPGSGGNRRENTDKTEDLASWGYVVAGLDTSDTAVSVFPNGTVVTGQASSASIAGANAALENRLLDMQFVLDQLAILNTNDARLAGRLDLERIGAFGHSFGGITSAQLCLRDARCKAGAGFDAGYLETNLLTQPLKVPWLYFRSEVGPDPDPVYAESGGRANDQLRVYNNLVTNAYWVKLGSTVHGNFADPGLVDQAPSVASGIASYWGYPLSGQFLPPARTSQIVRAYLLSFFNKFLRGKDDHLLDAPSPAYPEIMQFLSKATGSNPPAYPSAALVLGSDGNFYGTTRYGGAANMGTVFQVSGDGVLKTIASFDGPAGAYPFAELVEGGDGAFYGTAAQGGTFRYGTVFRVTIAGELTAMVPFDGARGGYSDAGLVQGTNGSFYGTTLGGGVNDLGVVFQVTPAGALTNLASFQATSGIVPRGGAPYGTLVFGADDILYGTTSTGGANAGPSGVGAGTVFKITPDGSLTTLASFNGANGFAPTGLTLGSDGNFYGTTANGGDLTLNGLWGFGTAFKMTPKGQLTRLVVFNGANGSFPEARLLQGADGNFYGTTAGGGAGGGGTIFQMTPASVLTTLVSFNGPNGSRPQAGLIQGTDGNFYGTTEFGGAGGLGTVFKMTPDGALTTLVSFGRPSHSP